MRATVRWFGRRITKNNINTTQKPQENKLTDVGLCGNIKLATINTTFVVKIQGG